MDQGDAAVWAGAIGVAGSLLGGIAGYVTARISSKDQRTITHGHWLHEQRQASYQAMYLAGEQVKKLILDIERERGRTPCDEASVRSLREALGDATITCANAVVAMSFVGPMNVVQVARGAAANLDKVEQARHDYDTEPPQ
ncbi:hypothetical protein [Streptomyces sp. HUAS ZL42]|uniref:hypothetical protein n=1 Tax=Streptomyces sp. HUAS ZL42 TaxID=3231715 RepID=UPI00345E8DD4